MVKDLSKTCADSLRTLSQEKYGIKLKASHAHELVAAYFGYNSQNAMLADRKYPISNLHQAEIIILMPDEFIDQRRAKLQELPKELPDRNTLGKRIASSLFSDNSWQSIYPVFDSFEEAAEYIAEFYHPHIKTLFTKGNHPYKLFVDKKITEDIIHLTVYYAYASENSPEEMECNRIITIDLPRLAGHIGYGKPKVFLQTLTSEFKQSLKSLRVNYE